VIPISPSSIPIPLPSSSTSSAAARLHSPFSRLRIGSSGNHAPYLSLQTDTAAARAASEHAYSPISDSSKDSSALDGTSSPFSPAASFLSTFSPETRTGGFASFHVPIVDGDAEGFRAFGHVLGRELGHGGFGVVREALREEDGQKVAVKIVRHQQPAIGMGYPSEGAGVQKRVSSGFKVATGGIRRQSSLNVPSRSERIRSTSSPAPTPMSLSRSSSAQILEGIPSTSSPQPLPSTTPTAYDPLPSPTFHLKALLQKEILLWQQLAPHPHLVPLLAVHHTSEFTYIFMPLCEGGNLLSFLNNRGQGSHEPRKRGRTSFEMGGITRSTRPSSLESSPEEGSRGLPFAVCRPIFAQVVSGLHYLHAEAGVTHKDVKLENILCDEKGGTWKIADFGLAEVAEVNPVDLVAESRRPSGEGEGGEASHRRYTITSSDRTALSSTSSSSLARASSLTIPSSSSTGPPSTTHAPSGSLPYSAPEQLSSSPSPTVDPSVDIWALGCVLYALIEGKLPMDDEFEPRLRMKILRGAWDIPSVLICTVDDPPHSPHPSAVAGGRTRSRDDAEKKVILQLLQGCLEPDPSLRWTIERVRTCEWLNPVIEQVQTRGRAGFRSGSSETGSRSPSASGGVRRKERSTSRGPGSHYGVDPRTRSKERKAIEMGERKMRWEREGRGMGGSRSASRGDDEGGRARERESSERLGRVAEPY
jgi:serine/threonine protein kinase